MRVWIEAGSDKFDHGGAGWEFGTCIWSPAVDRRGAQGRYGIMLQVKEGDFVINCCDGVIRGTSYVAAECGRREKPPNPGPWAYAKTFFRIDLRDFQPESVAKTLSQIAQDFKNEIRKDIEDHRPSYYLFSLYPRSEFYPDGRIVLSQGRFLAKATPALSELFGSLMSEDARTKLSKAKA